MTREPTASRRELCKLTEAPSLAIGPNLLARWLLTSIFGSIALLALVAGLIPPVQASVLLLGPAFGVLGAVFFVLDGRRLIRVNEDGILLRTRSTTMKASWPEIHQIEIWHGPMGRPGSIQLYGKADWPGFSLEHFRVSDLAAVEARIAEIGCPIEKTQGIFKTRPPEESAK